MVQVAIMGYGTIGSGVAEILAQNAEQIKHGCGQDVALKYVLDLRDFPGSPVEDRIVHDFSVIEKDPEVSVVVETMGGLNPAYPFVKASLLAGKHVVTSNKALVAAYGTELLAIARKKNVNFFFEASVGGGIPIIRPLNSSLTADEIDEISGILNGTTNYILSKMTSDGSEFEDVLKNAQELGYAERNPAADVEGWDACRKIAILSSLAFGHHVDFEEIYTEGITKITSADIRYAKAFGATIKLLATSKRIGDKYYAMVCPVMINGDSPLFSVNDVFNAIVIHGNMLGDAMFYGSGAGKLPTASAVVADVVDVAKHLNRFIMTGWSSEKLEMIDISQVESRFFVRMKGSYTESLAKVEEVFGTIDAKVVAEVGKEFGFITSKMKEEEYRAKAAQFDNIIGMIRVRF